MEEKDLNSLIFEYLQHDRSVIGFRINSGKMAGGAFYKSVRMTWPELKDRGFADWFILIRGKALFVECKRDTLEMVANAKHVLKAMHTVGKQKDEQVAFQHAIEKNGAKYILAYTLDEIISAINELKNSKE